MTNGQQQLQPNSGSRWHRWDPHIHAPGTVLADQFGIDHDAFDGGDAWEKYLGLIETASPSIRALGITDYYVTDSYQQVRNHKEQGRLPGCDLIFPNVELRLDKGTMNGQWVNTHLLVCPDVPDHVDELHRFLQRLSFQAHNDTFSCTKADLIRLGRRVDTTLNSERAALQKGCEQFKVSLNELRQEYINSDWAQRNVVVAVAAGQDGASGMDRNAGATLRQEIEKFAHAIFSGSPRQRAFWSGHSDVVTIDQLFERYDGPKPCLHGCDAHRLATVGKPDEGRYCWLKGAVSFDTLRQACLDPVRAYVGTHPPSGAHPSQSIKSVTLQHADWAKTPQIDLNPGLVAIIGARGSGKTALADVIALGCDAVRDVLTDASFLGRAIPLLGDASVTLEWDEGEPATRRLDLSDGDSADGYSRARYLSQKFVERLCSANEITDALLEEIERVVFEAHDPANQDGTSHFQELRDLRAMRFRRQRAQEQRALAQLSVQFGIEREKERLVPSVEKQLADARKRIEGYERDRAKLVAKGSEERMARLAVLTKAADAVRSHIAQLTKREQSLLSLRDTVSRFRAHDAQECLRNLKAEHGDAGLTDSQWAMFILKYAGDVDAQLEAKLCRVGMRLAMWKGTAPATQSANDDTPILPSGSNLKRQSLAILDAEISRIHRQVSADKDATSKFKALSERIKQETSARDRLSEQLKDCEGAGQRKIKIVAERKASYKRVFESIVGEEQVLKDLYAPLSERLAQGSETVRLLSFSVERDVDVYAWAKAGEELLDRRVDGSFKGVGTLKKRAEESLRVVWEKGSPEEVSAALSEFIEEHRKALLEHSPVPPTQRQAFREWAERLATWLYSTDHIAIQYSIDYGGTDIRKLSPGTRGIIMVLLYLALDSEDDRPLIIDQPEENLDPKSIYTELVGVFQEAKTRRQIILVTHNANLVVNANADQIVVASAGPHALGGLPPISYQSGGLEDKTIRDAVCDILEGGERALQERARRLRVKLER